MCSRSADEHQHALCQRQLFSISRRLARQLAWQTAMALALLCGVIFGSTWMLVQSKLDKAWDALRLVVQKIVLYAAPKGETCVVEMLQL